MLIRWFLPVAALILIADLPCRAAEPAPASHPAIEVPFGPLPDGLGVNIHFTDPRPGEMEMLAAGGFSWVRMDFSWSGIERKQGEYDFSAYDRLTAALQSHGMRPIFILDYSNRNYDNNLSPHTDEGRAAFAAWAAASVRHFNGRGILWEMYNEPNIQFWRPKPNVEDYVKLALAVGKAIRAAEPGETYIGPGANMIDPKFMEVCFKAGLLEYWSAVSCHPYRQSEPETVATQYRQLRLLIAKYAPPGKRVPIISGEWGYSTSWNGMSEEKQGEYLARQWLTNLWQEAPLSIWYDWHDDGPDPREPEHHFGAVRYPYRKNQTPVYEPKPSYLAAQTIATQLAGYRFNKRLMMEWPEDFVPLFDKGDHHQDVRLVVWTTAKDAHVVTILASAGGFAVMSHLGEKLPDLAADAKGLAVMLTGAPQYLVPQKLDETLRIAAAWERAPLERFVRGPTTVNLRDFTQTQGRSVALARADVDVAVDRRRTPIPLRLTYLVAGLGTLVQQTDIIVTNPLDAALLPRSADALPVKLQDPGGEGFKGTISLVGVEGLEASATQEPVELKPGQTRATVRFPITQGKSAAAEYAAGVHVTNDAGQVVLDVSRLRLGGMVDFADGAIGAHTDAWKLQPDGDAKVHSDQALTVETPPEGAPEPGMGVLKIAYKTEPGWRFWEVKPNMPELRKIEWQPTAYGLWIYGDGKGGHPHVRFTDSTGQTFQPAAETITWRGWEYVTFPMQASMLADSHWGGENDGVIHYPIHWESVFLLDRDAKGAAEGTVYISGATLVR